MLGTLKGRISIIYLSLVVVIAIIGAGSVINLYRLSKDVEGLMTDNYKSIRAVNHMLDALEKQDGAVLTYISMNRQKGIDLFSENNSSFMEWYNIEYNNITEAGEIDRVKTIGSDYQKYVKLFSQLQELRISKGVEKALNYYNTDIIPVFNRMKEEMGNLSRLNEDSMFLKKDKVTDSTRNSMYLLLIASAIAVTGGFLLSLFFTNRSLKPVLALTQAVRLVKAGDLNRQIRVTSQDELGELAQEFNQMTKRLQEYEQSTLGSLLSEKNKTLAVVKSISDPLIVLDTQFRIVLLNDACERFFDIQEESVINRYFIEVVHNGELFEHISGVLVTKEDSREKILQFSSDADYYYNVVVSTVKDNQANITGIIVAFQDVTQLKKLERVKTDFVATISHEFKTPLTSIIMGTSLILEESMGSLNEEQKSVMNAIKEDELRLSNLVTELLELSKIESDQAMFNFTPCSVERMVRISLQQFLDQAEQKEVSMSYEIEEDLPRVQADFDKIIWVLNNLVANALKYTSVGDEIMVSARVKEEKMFVSVKDTGIGIPPEFQDKIFGKFVQVKGQDREVRGTGLGLAIVKEIIQNHGGEIWCESTLDDGSEFIFTLPLEKREGLK